MTTHLVRVTWHDAHATATDVYTKAKHHAPAVMYTVGWLLDDDGIGVSVACERYPDDVLGWNYRGHTFIPRGIVVKIERLS